jgi:multiple sugar transport system substrate-binding protein
MMKLGDGKVVRPPAPIYTSLEGVYGLQLNQAMAGRTTPESALQVTDTLFKNILTGNQMIPYGVSSYDDTLANTVALINKLSS